MRRYIRMFSSMTAPDPTTPLLVSDLPPRGWRLESPPQNIDLVLDEALSLVSVAPGGEAWIKREGVLKLLVDAVRERGAGWWSLPPLYIRCVELSGHRQARFLLSVVPPRPELAEALEALTPAQLEVAEYAASGATIKEIASALQRSPNTIRSHLKVVYEALWVGNRVELAKVLRRPAISYGS